MSDTAHPSPAAGGLKVLQVTDCHLFASADGRLRDICTLDTLGAVLAQAAGEAEPDAILATGDIAQEAEPATYATFLAAVRARFDAPLLCVPGNHDSEPLLSSSLPVEPITLAGDEGKRALAARMEGETPSLQRGPSGGMEGGTPSLQKGASKGMEGEFQDGASGGRASRPPYAPPRRVFGEAGTEEAPRGWRLVGIDTHIEGRTGGRTGNSARARLAQEISEASEHVLVAGHHAPVRIGTDWLDQHRIEDGDELLDCLGTQESGSPVRAYVFGHVHQTVEMEHGSLRLLASPSTCFQFTPNSAGFGVDDKPPGYRWLTLHADGSVTTEVRWLAAENSPER